MKRRLHAGLCMTAIGGLLIASLGASAAVAAEKPGDDVLSALAATAQTDEAPDVLSNTADPASVGVIVPGNSSDPVVIASGDAAIEVTLPGAAADAVTIGDGLVGFDGGDGSTSSSLVRYVPIDRNKRPDPHETDSRTALHNFNVAVLGAVR